MYRLIVALFLIGACTDSTVAIVNPDMAILPDLGGELVGMQEDTPLDQVNLSKEGVLDWAHWGLHWGTKDILITRKDVPQHYISNYEVIGNGDVHQFTNNPIKYSWDDGFPTQQDSGTNSIIYIYAKGNGFKLTVNADGNPHTLRLYISSYAADFQLKAIMSDGSAVNYKDTVLNSKRDSVHKVYTFVFRAKSDNQFLEVSWVDIADNWAGANVTLQAATLE